MSSTFWPKKAWETNLILPMGPWAIVDDPTSNAPRLRQALDPFWTEKLKDLDPLWISKGGVDRFLEIRETIKADTVIGAGFEMIEGAILDPDHFWFFELGMLAWMSRLAKLRQDGLFPDTPGRRAALKIEEIWAKQGPQAVCEQLDRATQNNPTTDTVVALYRLPLAIWHERDLGLAVRLLDHLASRLDGDIILRLGATWPLTFGLIHALRGDLNLAETLLNQEKVASRPRGWKGLSEPEAQYQRARYLWGMETPESTKEALRLLEEVVGKAPVFILRIAGDVGFNQVNVFENHTLHDFTSRILVESSSMWTRWQQAHGSSLHEDANIARAQETVRRIGAEGYILVAASRALPEGGIKQSAKFDRAFLSTVERLQGFLAALPDTLSFGLGNPGDARQIIGNEDSEATRLANALKIPGDHTFDLVNKLQEELPNSLKMGLVHYGLMLSQALNTAGEIVESELEEANSPEGRRRLKEIVSLLNDCLAQVEPIKEVGKSGREKSVLGVGSELSRQVIPIWATFMNIQERWAKYNLTAFGRMNILPDLMGGEVLINEGSFGAIRVGVSDGAGMPLAGIPVFWKIASGPARARGLATQLAEYIDISLKSGRAILSVEPGIGKKGDSGKIDIQVLGQRAPITISYRIV